MILTVSFCVGVTQIHFLEVIMKRKVLCIALALLMCMMVTLPTFADSSAEILPERSGVSATFGLKHISGGTYRMWAKLNNPSEVSVYVRLTLYDASYNQIASIYKTSSNPLISLNKDVVLSSGTYHLRLYYVVNGLSYSTERTYTL